MKAYLWFTILGLLYLSIALTDEKEQLLLFIPAVISFLFAILFYFHKLNNKNFKKRNKIKL
jgi:flagellar biosynthesis protein FliQ